MPCSCCSLKGSDCSACPPPTEHGHRELILQILSVTTCMVSVVTAQVQQQGDVPVLLILSKHMRTESLADAHPPWALPRDCHHETHPRHQLWLLTPGSALAQPSPLLHDQQNPHFGDNQEP